MFPLNKNNIVCNNTENNFLIDYKVSTEIPILPHPGAFGKKRKNHYHEGVDLYCQRGDNVVAIEDGLIIKIKKFTGEHVGSDWWNNTWCVMVEGLSGVFNYGEIVPNKNLKEGMVIKEGFLIGNVQTVLKKDKGRPMTMLHLELYKNGTKDAINEWSLDTDKPEQLLDPTDLLLKIIKLENTENDVKNKVNTINKGKM